MSESLRDLLRQEAGTVEPPELDVNALLVRTERRMGRRRRARTTAGIAAVVLIAAGGLALQPGDDRVEPAPMAPTETPSAPAEWTPERIRAEGEAEVLIPPTESGLRVLEYRACVAEPCLRNRVALEVTQDDRTALFAVRGHWPSYVPAWAVAYDEDSVLVQDAHTSDATEDRLLDGPVRYRLLRADGSQTELEVLDEPVRAAPGPDLVLIDELSREIRGFAGVQVLYLVDERAGSLHPLETPEGIAWWGPNYREFLWGGGGCRVMWQAADGGFDAYELPGCRAPDDAPHAPTSNGDVFQGWLAPGRMAVVDWTDEGARSVTVSTDYGATWQRVPVEGGGTCSGMIQPCLDAVAATLRGVE